MNFIKSINENSLVFAILVMYVPIHLFEEAMGNFPKWMYTHKWLNEEISYGHWLANNIFFYYSLMLLAYLIYGFTHTVILAYGIILWGIINMLDHVVYTIIDGKKSPGIFSGFAYGIISIVFILKEINQNNISLINVLFGLLIAIVLAGLPVVFAMIFHNYFKLIFGTKRI